MRCQDHAEPSRKNSENREFEKVEHAISNDDFFAFVNLEKGAQVVEFFCQLFLFQSYFFFLKRKLLKKVFPHSLDFVLQKSIYSFLYSSEDFEN